MFEEWGFLLAEIWVLLALAALLGLIAGWLIFGGSGATETGDVHVECRADKAKLQSRIVTLEAQVAGAVAAVADPNDAGNMAVAAAPSDEIGVKPNQLDAPNGGQADDLKRISGVGPRMEQMCNMLGFWHYDQIANWSADEVAWVDDNLQGFKGRVTRDDWVAQAKILAEGGETEFSQKQDAAKSAAGDESDDS